MISRIKFRGDYNIELTNQIIRYYDRFEIFIIFDGKFLSGLIYLFT
jgi:hypothetical protein